MYYNIYFLGKIRIYSKKPLANDYIIIMVLTSEEILIVKGVGGYSGFYSKLNDNHISEFNSILKAYTDFNMQRTVVMQRLSNIQPVDSNNEYFQILVSGSNDNGHWIAIWYINNVIHVYDSLNKNFLNEDHIICINRLFPKEENLRVTYEKVQLQTNTHDCGVFAIAFVVSIVFGECPFSVKFDIKLIRKHLSLIFKNLAPFPLINLLMTMCIV